MTFPVAIAKGNEPIFPFATPFPARREGNEPKYPAAIHRERQALYSGAKGQAIFRNPPARSDMTFPGAPAEGNEPLFPRAIHRERGAYIPSVRAGRRQEVGASRRARMPESDEREYMPAGTPTFEYW